MELNQIELKKLSKQKLIEIIERNRERLIVMEECDDLLRFDSRRS